jgi:hypothetical protein
MTAEIPRPRGLPILGNILDIDPSDAVASLGKLAETHGKCTRDGEILRRHGLPWHLS